MNYACAFLGLILIAAAICWYAGGRNYYTGPVIEAQAEDSSSQVGVDMRHELGSSEKDEKGPVYDA
jgi:hypothetical protein